MGKPQARMFDLHGCFTPGPPPAPPVPIPVPTPINPPCCATVHVVKQPAARIFDLANPAFPHPIIMGSSTVMIGKLPAARIGDQCICTGAIVTGAFNVLVGG
ncbi:PAAR domain-containing protein [Marivita hallyeonensis]|uniref:Zn-binding Pro-Ala-Ala-Arg (PAAR) domain-containing protein, incolved in TypeVI secretion n=1 Tax=Marivita hallyeonensis TaxID=996342 RepID=A0A1M5PI49_9RHOB|nr:PAAR domain-containing protein [Marivita hallyeonensis]SHH01371.1 Zn-binding Pro-Ala-Ala-Arg (PAAR) domain-containing protein, incolved in TypeVI secretion [Marivita hallyeonensis]